MDTSTPRFAHLRGSMSRSELRYILRQTRYHKTTWKMLADFLVRGHPYAQNKGASRQFVYKKLCELEERRLLNT